MKRKLLIINKQPFGSLTDSYKWCQYLKDKYDITFISLDKNIKKERVGFSEVNHIYVSNRGNRTIRGLRFMLISLYHILFFRGVILVEFFNECIWFKKLMPHQKMMLDIRTLSVSNNQQINQYNDNRLKQTIRLYDHSIFISEGIRDKLNIDTSNTSIMPLGADELSSIDKSFDVMRMLYVGTFQNRQLEKTIEGVKLFHNKYPTAEFTYDIIGGGPDNENILLDNLIKKYELDKYITLRGRLYREALLPYFERCNIGVSFVPMTPYYEYQPVTKSFEYIMSGLFCIATSTYANKQIIKDDNGILINDTAVEFCKALEFIYLNPTLFCSSKIRESLVDYRWKNLVNKVLIPIIEKEI